MSFSSFQEKILERKPKEYYPYQSMDSKNLADLCLQVDASARRPSPPTVCIARQTPSDKYRDIAI